MPRLYREPTENSNPGSLTIEANCECCFDIFYIPSKERLEQSGSRLKVLLNTGSSCCKSIV